jgi:hypothetical protein
MAQHILSLSAISAADQRFIEIMYSRVLQQSELMKKLDKELRPPEQSLMAVNVNLQAETMNTCTTTEGAISKVDSTKSITSSLKTHSIIDTQLGSINDYICFAPEDIHPISGSKTSHAGAQMM